MIPIFATLARVQKGKNHGKGKRFTNMCFFQVHRREADQLLVDTFSS